MNSSFVFNSFSFHLAVSFSLVFFLLVILEGTTGKKRNTQVNTRVSLFMNYQRIVGNNSTSRIDCASVNSMTRRSIPIPKPPVGGMPYSSASRKSSSTPWASSFPSCRSFSCASNRCLWSIGSFNSVKALANSRPTINSSKRSVNRGSSGFFFARGETSTGCP